MAGIGIIMRSLIRLRGCIILENRKDILNLDTRFPHFDRSLKSKGSNLAAAAPSCSIINDEIKLFLDQEGRHRMKWRPHNPFVSVKERVCQDCSGHVHIRSESRSGQSLPH